MITISPNERLFISGRTNSGKTTFVRWLLRGVPRYAVLDAKHTYRPPLDLAEDVPIVPEYDPELDRQIIRGPWEEEPECWERAINGIFRDGNRLIYVDELTLIVPPRAARHPLGKAIRTGRERGIGVWTGTQRPKEVPSYVFTESEHILSYRLQYKADREKVVEFSGDQMASLLNRIRGHTVAYYSVADDRAIELRPRLVAKAGGMYAGPGGSSGVLGNSVRGRGGHKNAGIFNAIASGPWPWNVRWSGVDGDAERRSSSAMARAG